MKRIIVLLVVLSSISVTAQTQYQKGMKKAFDLWNQNKTAEASQLFERISKAEKENWLPSYYVATLEIISSFGIKDEVKLTTKLTKAQKFLDIASSISKNNPEIMITQALLNTAYIAFDGQKYGMTLSMKNTALYQKALKIAPNNPRVIIGNAEWNMGAARFFGKSTKPYCKEVENAISVAKKETPQGEFYPKFLFKRAEQVLKKCVQ